MSIISQIGVVILIAFIVLVLIRSNKNLKKASEEGESFVDEWALRQEKKEEIKQKREEKKLEVQKEKKQKKIQKQEKRKENPIYENTGEQSEDMPIYEDAEEQAEDRTFYDNAEEQQEDWSFYDNIEEQPGECSFSWLFADNHLLNLFFPGYHPPSWSLTLCRYVIVMRCVWFKSLILHPLSEDCIWV